MVRAGIGLDEVHRRVRSSLSTLADVALEIAMDREVILLLLFYIDLFI